MEKRTFILLYFMWLSIMHLHGQISTFIKKYNTQEIYSNETSVIRKTAQNKKYLTTGIGFMLITEINEQGDTTKTAKMIPYLGNIGGTVIDDAEGNLWFDGRRFNVPPFYYWQYCLSKLDTNLNPMFSKVFSSPSGNLSVTGSPLPDSTFLVQGLISQGGWNNPVDMALIKVDKNGDTLWSKKYDDGGQLLVTSLSPIKLLNSGSFIIAGSTTAIDTGDAVLTEIDANGNVIWSKAYGGNMSESGGPQFRSNNSIYTLCGTNSFGILYNGALLIKTDTLGNLIWAKSISCPNGFNWQSNQYENKKGVFTLTGMLVIPGTPYTSWDFLAMQIDTNGTVVNNKSYTFSPDEDYGLSFVRMNDGGYVFTLSEYNNSITNYDTKIFKTDSLFNSGCLPNTTTTFTTTDVTALMHVNTLAMVASPLYIDVINTVTFGSGRGCAIQTECNGFVGVKEQETQENSFNIYPNPANDVVYFDYQLLENVSQATVNVYNYAGMLVQSFTIYGSEGAGAQNVSGLSNGLYMFSILSNNTSIAQQKVVISK